MKKILLSLSVLAACCGYDESGIDAPIEQVQQAAFAGCGPGGVPYGWLRVKNICGQCWEMSAGTNVSNFQDWYTTCSNHTSWNDIVNSIETGGNASFRVYKHANYSQEYFSGGEYWYFWHLYYDGYQISSMRTYASPNPQ